MAENAQEEKTAIFNTEVGPNWPLEKKLSENNATSSDRRRRD
jgi:hypothetical protein